MKEKIDRRILRTQQQLREVLLNLAAEKPVESITVKELTYQAGLNRGTFYLHYQDIDDFYEQLKDEMLEQYYMIIKKLGHHIEGRESFVDPPAGFVRPFEYIREHQRFFKVFMGSTGDIRFSQRMIELIKQQFQYAYLAQHRQSEVAEIPLKQLYLFSYLASAYVGSLQFWIQRNFDLSPSEMAILFSKISRLGSANLYFED